YGPVTHMQTESPQKWSCLLLLLVVSHLLLCQGNVCPSCGPDMFGVPLKFLRKTFSRASRLSHDMHNLSTIMFNEFDEKYSQSRPEYINATSDCHTNPLHAPEEREKAQQMNNSLLLVTCTWNSYTAPPSHDSSVTFFFFFFCF
ncbi:hypothetical protein FD755_024524, partial [Muntiacus reevesi]